MESSTQKNNLGPRSIGIIMDGNRRFAKSKGIPSLEGHRAGYFKLREVLRWAKDAGITELIAYTFSTENWNRTTEEVGYLMNLFREMIGRMTTEAKDENMRLVFLGERARFAKDILDAIDHAESATKECTAFTFGIALSYGGRAEILDAIKRIPEEKRANISEEEFSALLWTREMQDPDLIIRTSGEERLSNFLPWQSVYSELFFTDTLWPEFSEEEFHSILTQYDARGRRMGK